MNFDGFVLRAKAPPNITQAVGSYKFDPKNSVLIWEIPLVNNSNRKGTIEFEISQWESGKHDPFPIYVTFSSDQSICHLEVRNLIEISVKYHIPCNSFVSFNG